MRWNDPLPAVALTAVVLSAVSAATPARAFDCERAATKVETLICGNADLKALDGQMARAYGETSARLSATDRAALASAQRHWIAAREICGEWDASEQVSCIKEQTGSRLAYLLPLAEPGEAGAFAPVLRFRPGRHGVYEQNVQLLQFAPADTAGKRLFNGEVKKVLGSVPDKVEEFEGAPTPTFDAAMSVYYASPSFVSAGVTIDEFSGSAHGMHSTQFINIDLAAGRAPAFADVFSTEALGTLTESCRGQIVAAKESRREPGDTAPVEFSDDYMGALREGVAGLGRWSFSDTAATVHFDAYAVGAYAEGPFTCTFERQVLQPYVRSTSPIFR